MEIYIPTTDKEFSQRKLEEYAKFAKIINEGRQNPVRFAEEFYGIKLMDYQKWCFMESWDKPFALWLCSRGTGKALSLDTKIPTPDGFTTMGELQVGNFVLGQDGLPTKVTYTSPVFVGNDCYEVTFSDGEIITADADHLWSVSDKASRMGRSKQCDENGLIVKNTEELFGNYIVNRNDKWNEFNYQVPLNDAVEYVEQELPINPYVLGLWLGDGTKRSSHITCSYTDIDETIGDIRGCGIKAKIQHNKNRAPAIIMECGKRGEVGTNKFINWLRELNLYCNKHIPEKYLFSSIEQRYELLRGLMDSDGTADKNGLCSFSQKDHDLILQFSQLLSSLGIKHNISDKISSCKGKKYSSYVVNFYCLKKNSCFKLKRKYDRLKKSRTLQEHTKTITNIKKIPSVPTKCIQVDNDRSLFLCGERFTVTHNTILASVFLQTKMVLIPDYKVYVSTNSAGQSIEVFKKIEDLALQRVPSFKTVTDIFANEVDKSGNSKDGFKHDPAGHSFRLYNNSELITLSSNVDTNRGKRGSVLYDETAWQSSEQMSTTENFINVDSNFSLGTAENPKIDPVNMPLQLLYCSSAGDVEYPFYDKYRSFAIKMIEGDRNYFACDLDAYDILNHSSVDGKPIKSHLTAEQIQKSIEEDPDAAERELFNKFRRGGGQNAVVSMDCLIANSKVRIPLFYNDTGKKKFIFCYDPARNFDGSVLSIWQELEDEKDGYKLKLERSISMVDTNTKKKTPLPMNEQLKIIKNLMIAYNGERAADWENIKFLIDSGAGGGGISAVADQLMEDWVDDLGNKRRGIIDPNHKQYETARKTYKNAVPIVELIDPKSHKHLIYDALGKMTKANLMNFTEYDNKNVITLENDDCKLISYELTPEEKLALVENNLLKNEISYMCRYETGTTVRFELSKDKQNKMHDDRAYTAAMAAYALSQMRRKDLTHKENKNADLDIKLPFRKPILKKH